MDYRIVGFGLSSRDDESGVLHPVVAEAPGDLHTGRDGLRQEQPGAAICRAAQTYTVDSKSWNTGLGRFTLFFLLLQPLGLGIVSIPTFRHPGAPGIQVTIDVILTLGHPKNC